MYSTVEIAPYQGGGQVTGSFHFSFPFFCPRVQHKETIGLFGALPHHIDVVDLWSYVYDSRFSEIANISFPLFDFPSKKRFYDLETRDGGVETNWA